MPKPKNETKDRDMTVDILRALSIIIMMVIHVNAYYLKDKLTLFVWSYGQWVVPAFVLCSFAVGSYDVSTLWDYLKYLKKRLMRLLVPYYIWLGANIILIFVVTKKMVSIEYLVKNIIFTGGSDFNWLVLLFIYFTIFGPFIAYCVYKKPMLGILTMLVGITLSSVIFLDQSQWNKSFRITMLLPWLAITVGLLFFLRLMREKKYKLVSLLLLICMLLYYFIHILFLLPRGMRGDLYFHKYPPNIYFVLFCLWTTPVAYVVSLFLNRFLGGVEIFKKIILYVSIHSYEIFFVHTLVLYVIDKVITVKNLTYHQFLLILFIATFILMKMLEDANRILRKFISK